MFTFFQAIILGVVEGVTEFLPISSTGHLILVSSLLHFPDTAFAKSFEIIIQLGAILAVAVLYWRKLLMNIEILKRVAIGFVPTAVIGLIFYKVVKYYFLGNSQIVLWAMLIGGLLLISFEKWHHEPATLDEKIESISYSHAAVIGLFQSVAIIPGVSRSAATIVGGLLLGYKRSTIVEFSFLLAVPTMLAATGLDLIKNSSTLFSNGGLSIIATGFIVSFIVALLAVRWLVGFIKKHTFKGFGIYRVVAAILGFLVIK